MPISRVYVSSLAEQTRLVLVLKNSYKNVETKMKIMQTAQEKWKKKKVPPQ